MDGSRPDVQQGRRINKWLRAARSRITRSGADQQQPRQETQTPPAQVVPESRPQATPSATRVAESIPGLTGLGASPDQTLGAVAHGDTPVGQEPRTDRTVNPPTREIPVGTENAEQNRSLEQLPPLEIVTAKKGREKKSGELPILGEKRDTAEAALKNILSNPHAGQQEIVMGVNLLKSLVGYDSMQSPTFHLGDGTAVSFYVRDNDKSEVEMVEVNIEKNGVHEDYKLPAKTTDTPEPGRVYGIARDRRKAGRETPMVSAIDGQPLNPDAVRRGLDQSQLDGIKNMLKRAVDVVDIDSRETRPVYKGVEARWGTQPLEGPERRADTLVLQQMLEGPIAPQDVMKVTQLFKGLVGSDGVIHFGDGREAELKLDQVGGEMRVRWEVKKYDGKGPYSGPKEDIVISNRDGNIRARREIRDYDAQGETFVSVIDGTPIPKRYPDSSMNEVDLDPHKPLDAGIQKLFRDAFTLATGIQVTPRQPASQSL